METYEKGGHAYHATLPTDAPGVVVSYTTDADIQSGKKFLNEGLQTAAGVPLLLLDLTSLSRQNLLQRADPNKPHVNQSRFNRQLQTAHHVVQLH